MWTLTVVAENLALVQKNEINRDTQLAISLPGNFQIRNYNLLQQTKNSSFERNEVK